MKYTEKTPPLKCIMTNSTCYQSSYPIQMKGIIIHSIKGEQLKRYVQPDSSNSDLLSIIGINKEQNDLNHAPHNYGVNAWIGELEDGTIATVQTLPWDYRSWGCGVGNLGTCNDGWIQITICENDNKIEEIKNELTELISYLCKLFNIDKQGYHKSIPAVLLHPQGYSLGMCQLDNIWLKKFETKEEFTPLVIDTPHTNYTAEVIVGKLNIRAGAGMDYARIGALHKGNKIKIIEEINDFGKLADQDGWVSLKYIKEVK